jgi:hypothetical protein
MTIAPRFQKIFGLACVAGAVALILRLKRSDLASRELGPIDLVERSSMDSFPASDAPPWNPPGSFEIH